MGTTTVDKMAKAKILFHVSMLNRMVECIRTDVRVFEKIGDTSCPTAPPMGFAVASIQLYEKTFRFRERSPTYRYDHGRSCTAL